MLRSCEMRGLGTCSLQGQYTVGELLYSSTSSLCPEAIAWISAMIPLQQRAEDTDSIEATAFLHLRLQLPAPPDNFNLDASEGLTATNGWAFPVEALVLESGKAWCRVMPLPPVGQHQRLDGHSWCRRSDLHAPRQLASLR